MNRFYFPFFISALLILQGCQSGAGETAEESKQVSALFSAGESKGILDKTIDEASGLVRSVNNPTSFWTHNDSAGVPCIFLINESGQLLWTVCLEGQENRDWEDIAVGPGPEAGKNYVYVAEIGDNNAVHERKYLYRLEEPMLDVTQLGKDTTVALLDTIQVNYADGKRDAETLMIDPGFNKFIIVSKREEHMHVYEGDLLGDKHQVLEKVGTLPFRLAVAGDLSEDGSEILVKNYDNIFYWKRTDSSVSLGKWITNNPFEVLQYEPESQGESIAWKPDGSGYYTVSEVNDNKPVDVLFYRRN